jgi:hypothetical protein
MNEKLLTLPFELQLALGSGYLAYALAYIGIRGHHQTADTVFRTFAFGLIAWAVLAIVPVERPWLRVAGAVLSAIVAGALWRALGIEMVRKAMRATNYSWADEAPSAWATLYANHARSGVTQVSVLHEDGTWLNCDLCHDFETAPHGPFVLGPNGDIALYVTDEEKDGVIHRCDTVRDDEYGDRLTYVPAAKIKRIALRFKAR